MKTVNKGKFEVIGIDPNETYTANKWMVRRPDGLECSGRWISRESAQADCDRWNNRSIENWAESNPEGI